MFFNSAIILCLAITFAHAVDYCGKLNCPPGTTHVACNNPLINGGFGPECPSDAKVIKMTQELKNRFLDIMNKQRNQQALGQTPNYEPAARMATLRWDHELAKFAELRARTCHYGHDGCTNTKKWGYAGQNIAESFGKTDGKGIIDYVVPGWFEDENQNGYIAGWMDMINNFQDSPDDKIVVGHFTQIVWGNSDAVGCAISLFNGNTAFVICNFAQGNLMGTPVYEAGTTASKCETGTNPKYPGLCSESEQFSGQPTIPGFDNSAPAGSNGGGAGSPMVIPANCDEACIRDILVQNGFSPDTEFTVVG